MIVLAAALLVLVPGPVPGEKPPAFRVFVHSPAPAAGVSADEARGLLDSARDLTEALSRRKSDFAVVATASEADVTVEVVNREERDAPQGGFGGATVTPFRETILRLHVSYGEHSADLKGIGRPSWKSAAKDAAERLFKWARTKKRPALSRPSQS